MKPFLFYLALILSFWLSYCQTLEFNLNYPSPGSSCGAAVLESPNGNYLLATNHKENGDEDIYLLQIDQQGTLIWEKKIGHIGTRELAYSLINTSDLNFLLAGVSEGNSPYLVKVDQDGDVLWEKSFFLENSLGAFSLKEANDGGYLFVAKDSLNSFLFKVDAQGDSLWTKVYDQIKVRSVVQHQDGGFSMAGNTKGLNSEFDFALMRTNSIGSISWIRYYEGEPATSTSLGSQDYGTSLVLDDDGSYYFGGSYNPVNSNDPPKAYVAKIDSQGNLLWSNNEYQSFTNHIICCCSNTGVLVGFREIFIGSNGQINGFLILTRFNQDGSEAWNQVIFGSINTLGNNICENSDGSILITGHDVNSQNSKLVKFGSISTGVESAVHSKISVYPNPNNGVFSISIDSDISSLLLRNSAGMKIPFVVNALSSTFMISFEDKPGLYFLEIYLNDGSLLTRKILKQ